MKEQPIHKVFVGEDREFSEKPKVEYQQTGESCRNRITCGGVSIWIRIDRSEGWVSKQYAVRCTQHATEESFRNISEARKRLHKPWAFCGECEKIWKRSLK